MSSVKNRKRGSEDFFSSSGYAEDVFRSGGGVGSPLKRVTRAANAQQQQSTKYPETISAFADGIRSDFFDIFSTGASALGSTVRMFFPMHSVDESTEDSLKDIEVTAPEGAGMTPSTATKLKVSFPSPSPLKQKLKESQSAIRMRCSNLWPEPADAPPSEGDKRVTLRDLLASAAKDTDDGKELSQAKKNNAKAQAGGKVLLAKLTKNPTIQYFPCGESDNKLVILGNLRMIHCVKNNDEQETATIIWCEKFQEIASCVISCTVGNASSAKAGELQSRLDITTRDDKKFSVLLQDATRCIQVMQIIQQRCLPAASKPGERPEQQQAAPPSNESVDLLGLDSFKWEGAQTGLDDAALTIGSSPLRTSSRRLASKRPAKPKLMVNIRRDSAVGGGCLAEQRSKENRSGVINRLPPPLAASAPATEVNLIEFDDEPVTPQYCSPTKRVKLTREQDDCVGSSAGVLDTLLQMTTPVAPAAPVAPSVAPVAPPAPCASEVSAVLPDGLKKYASMLKTGVPLPAVRQKMAMEGVSAADMRRMEALLAAQPVVPAPAPAPLTPQKRQLQAHSPMKPAADCSIPTHLKKYQLMSKSGVPRPAVMQKMALEGRTSAEISLVFSPADGGKAGKEGETPAALKKFQTMLKSGIPPGAVTHKMTMEGVSAADQALVLGAQQPPAPAARGVATPLPSTGPQLLGLHWEPIAETNASLSTSMWGNIMADTETPEQHCLQEKEFDSLSSMFSRKATPASVKGGAASACENKAASKAKNKMPTTIDMSRSTNISIGMSSFKQKKLTTEAIVRAINLLDTSVLNHEDLCRLFEILPSESEVKTFSGKVSAAGIEGFHDTEKWLHRLASVERCREKVHAMIFMTSFSVSAAATSKDLQALVTFTQLVVACTSLREVMKCILAIGNSLNQGTYKGSARGFRLGSLLKLQQTKSTDGKSTVMDYLIQVLHSRYITGDMNAGNALSLNDELCDVAMAKNINITETNRDVAEMRKQLDQLMALFKSITAAKDSSALLIDTDFENESNTTFISTFICLAEARLQELEGLQEQLAAACDSVVLFFGEERGASVQHMYSLLAEFVAGFSQAKKKFEEGLRRESRLKAAAAKKAEAAAAKK